MIKRKPEPRPLRRIVGWVKASLVTTLAHATSIYEVYECGHACPTKKDIYGETNAVRRRCGKCMRSKPRDIDPADDRIVPFR